MARRLAKTLALVACLHIAAGSKLASQDVGASGDIKVHGVASTPLRPEEIKDAYHEPAVVMEEVQRLRNLGLIEAVQAIVEGTAKMAAGEKATSKVIDEYEHQFAVAMRGYTFLDINDAQRPENIRYRKALFVAACASLSAEARARAASTPA